ncbi:DNA-binding transcriptional regulator SoxS [compost metagenome]
MEEGVSYQDLKDALRRDLAIEALSHSGRPVADIAAELGFAEPGAFHRAFRRWTGSRPGAYRRVAEG